MTSAEALFFSAQPALLPLYAALAEASSRYPDVTVRVQKTQITYVHRYVFLCASIRRVKGAARLVVTFGLPHRVDSPRIWQAVEPYPNRWTHHVLVSAPGEVDTELLAWLDEAYAFAARR